VKKYTESYRHKQPDVKRKSVKRQKEKIKRAKLSGKWQPIGALLWTAQVARESGSRWRVFEMILKEAGNAFQRSRYQLTNLSIVFPG
jgi:hypothetical protein